MKVKSEEHRELLTERGDWKITRWHKGKDWSSGGGYGGRTGEVQGVIGEDWWSTEGMWGRLEGGRVQKGIWGMIGDVQNEKQDMTEGYSGEMTGRVHESVREKIGGAYGGR